MSKKLPQRRCKKTVAELAGYDDVLAGIVDLLEAARRTSARAVNAVMTATYWEVGRRIVDGEQKGAGRAEYGTRLIKRLSGDLTAKFGRGFGVVNLAQMRRFYLTWEPGAIFQTVSEKSASPPGMPSVQRSSRRFEVDPGTGILQTPSEKSSLEILQTASAKLAMPRFPLSWSHYVKLLSVQDPEAREFYETEALRGGWPVRQLDRQIASLFYERTLLSRNKAAMLRKGSVAQPADAVTPEEEIKDPLVLEFLGLKDEYSESELEDALIQHLETRKIAAPERQP